MDLSSLEPEAIWKNFSSLNAVPRPSKKEERVIDFMQEFGESLRLETVVDSAGNVIIRKSASAGMEDRPMVTLQAHLDMVHQKNNDTVFDFSSEGINMYAEDGWVTAEGTTLGADNGIGVAAIMSLLDSDSIVHPALEALFTVDEETGMTGAFELKPNVLEGEVLLNLDTEEDDEIDIGCAGGVDVTASRNYAAEEVTGPCIVLEVGGLKGGHSGMDIDKGRGNVNVVLTRLLLAGIDNGIRLIDIDAGGLRNAIPREAKATVAVNHKEDYLEEVELLKAQILDEYKGIEEDLSIKVSEKKVSGIALSSEDSEQLIKALKAAHNGVYRMSPNMVGLVEASNNIARLTLENGRAEVQCLARSSVKSTKYAVANQLKAAFELGGLETKFSGSYPGWQPDPDAAITAILEEVYQEMFDEEPRVVACHAGLECGVIGATYPDMEMVSFGPTIKGAHSPDERVSIQSVQKFWNCLKEILKNIPPH